jgi:hypothetical protein
MLVHPSLISLPPPHHHLHPLTSARSQLRASVHTAPLPSSEGCGPVQPYSASTKGSRWREHQGGPMKWEARAVRRENEARFRRASVFAFIFSVQTTADYWRTTQGAKTPNHSRSNETRPTAGSDRQRQRREPSREGKNPQRQHPVQCWVRSTTSATQQQVGNREDQPQPTAGYGGQGRRRKPDADVSNDAKASSSPRRRVERHNGIGTPKPTCRKARRIGTSRRRVEGHEGTGSPTPLCRSIRRSPRNQAPRFERKQEDPNADVSNDTKVLQAHHHVK